MDQNIQIPYFRDIKQIIQFSSQPTYRLGLHDYTNNCVTECYLQNNVLVAHVEDSEEEIPVQVSCYQKQDNDLHVSCDCGQEAEYVCRHAVAGLLFYANEVEQQANNSFSSARESAIKDRKKRGRTEVQVELIDGSHPPEWRASSLKSATHWHQDYRVTLRSMDEAVNHCTCPDWRNNQLGTCKHIEAVLHHISNHQRDFKPASLSFVYRAWEQQKPVLKLHRAASVSAELADLLDNFFDSSGAFTGSLPQDFYRLRDAVSGFAEFQLGEDAHHLVEHLVRQLSEKLQSEQIRQQITFSQGKIPGVKAKLYPYQAEGVAFLAANGRAILADDMGLGKTLQAISAAIWLHQFKQVQRVLILCPASLKHQWAREIEKFTGLESQIIQGNPAQRTQQYKQQALFFIANYELMLADWEQVNQQLKPDLLILDEAQRLKNWQTKTASTIKLLRSEYAFVLSGTPLENRLEDLYSLMQIVNPQILGPLWRYMSDYHLLTEKGKVVGYRNLTQLRQLIAPVMLRRNRSIVNDQLPSRSNTQIDVLMTSQQQGYHNSAMSAASQLANIAKKRPLTPSERNRLMAALQQARMACCAAGLIDKETTTSPKLNELRELLTTLCLEQGEKVVIFSQWKTMTTLTENLLNEMGIGSVHLHGGVPTGKRGELIDRFHQDDSVNVFLSTDAGGTGLNLQCATVLINLDVPWNPAVLEQRNARIHRLGQKRQVQIMLIVAADSYEQRVLELVKNKQNLFDNVISPDASEDVVGVSKKGFEVILDELNQEQNEKPTVDDANEVDTPAEPVAEEPAQVQSTATSDKSTESDAAFNRFVADLQANFASRISQILSHNNSLLLILDELTERDEAFLQHVKGPVPVAAIDLLSLKQLNRLGELSPLAGSQPLVLEEQPDHSQRWLQHAHQGLTDATQLLSNQQSGGLSKLADVVCALLSAIADRAACFDQQQAMLWLYGEGQQVHQLDSDGLAVIGKVFSLAHIPQPPQSLAEEVLSEVEALLVQCARRLTENA